MTAYRIVTLAVTVALGSCASSASSSDSANEARAACAAKAYLQSNGYIAPLETFDPSTIDLGLWDRLTYEKDGVIDWGSLVIGRQGLFSNRLYGAGRRDDGYLVFYQIDGNFSCVTMSADFSNADLREANCRAAPPIVRLSERDLRC